MGKELDLLFTVTFGIIFWILGEHEPLLLPFFLYHLFWVLEGTIYSQRE